MTDVYINISRVSSVSAVQEKLSNSDQLVKS